MTEAITLAGVCMDAKQRPITTQTNHTFLVKIRLYTYAEKIQESSGVKAWALTSLIHSSAHTQTIQ